MYKVGRQRIRRPRSGASLHRRVLVYTAGCQKAQTMQEVSVGWQLREFGDHLCWLGKFSLFSTWLLEGKTSLAVWDAISHSWRAWRCARACGNYPFFLFVFSLSSIFHFVWLSSPWQWRVKPILLWVDVTTKLSCISTFRNT